MIKTDVNDILSWLTTRGIAVTEELMKDGSVSIYLSDGESVSSFILSQYERETITHPQFFGMVTQELMKMYYKPIKVEYPKGGIVSDGPEYIYRKP